MIKFMFDQNKLLKYGRAALQLYPSGDSFFRGTDASVAVLLACMEAGIHDASTLIARTTHITRAPAARVQHLLNILDGDDPDWKLWTKSDDGHYVLLSDVLADR